MAFRHSSRFLRLAAKHNLRWGSLMEFGRATQSFKNYSIGMAMGRTAQNLDANNYLQPEFDSSRAIPVTTSEISHDNRADRYLKSNMEIGKNVSRKDKAQFIVNLLLDLKESREAVYGALDAWVAWEQTFPLVSLRRALLVLEKEQQWHKVVQVIKWMLSKGQGTTMGTYEQLIRALEKDFRAEEAHKFWEQRIGNDFHSVPWQLCRLMISIYYRNNMPERLVKLFKGLETFSRKPPDKSVVQQVANAYEILGLFDEQKRVLERYSDLFNEVPKKNSKKGRKVSNQKG